MANIIVIGAQWGDEGKGKVVDIYTEFADVVVRFQGGSNAGHTVVVGNDKIILHQIPSGILHPEKICIIGNGLVLNLETLMDEIEELKRHGHFQDESKLLISEEVQLVLPYHRLIDLAREKRAGNKKIGTTGRGIGPAYEDKVARNGIRFIDLFDREAFAEKLDRNLETKRADLQSADEELDRDELLARFEKLAQRLKSNLANTSVSIDEAIRAGKNVLLEGAQGTLLDVDHGTYPFVTSSNTVAGGACSGAGIGPTQIDGVLGIVKAYTTRVGEGPFPTELTDEIGKGLQERGGEFGATTGRPRRCGWFDAVVVRHAARVNGFTGMALTKLDVLSGLQTIKICTGYLIDGQVVRDFPASVRAWQRCEPIYEELPGWQEDLTSIRRVEDLPAPTQLYVQRLEELVGVKFILISVGVRRDETIMLKNPFSLTRNC